MPTYGRWDVAVERGEGCYLYATDGRKFLDFTSGIAVTALGHCHPYLIEAVTAQAKKLWHVSNLFQIPGQQKLATDMGAGERSVRTYLKELEEANLLEVTQRGLGKTNLYRLHLTVKKRA